MPDPAPSSDDFYVGYLPLPAGLRRFLWRIAPVFVGLLIAAGIIIAGSQPDPGDGVWEDAPPRSLTGVVIAAPYPMLFTADLGTGEPALVLVVEPGKHGSSGRMAALDGKAVQLTGTILRRQGRCMLELDEGPGAIQESPASPGPFPAAKALGPVTLRGEIVDSKCYLGAMKPGAGKTHKECAMLCVSGGIPPVFVTRDDTGKATLYLLMDPSGGPLDRSAIPFIADPIELTGELEELGGMLRLRVRGGDIHRI